MKARSLACTGARDEKKSSRIWQVAVGGTFSPRIQPDNRYVAPGAVRKRRTSAPRLASPIVPAATIDAPSPCPLSDRTAPPLPSLFQKYQPRVPVRFFSQITRLTLPSLSSSSSVRSSNQTFPGPAPLTTSTGLPTTIAASSILNGAPG